MQTAKIIYLQKRMKFYTILHTTVTWYDGGKTPP